MVLAGALRRLSSSCCLTAFSDKHDARAVLGNVPVSSADETELTSLAGSMVMGTLDYRLDSVMEVLDAVASDRSLREGPPGVTFRSTVM